MSRGKNRSQKSPKDDNRQQNTQEPSSIGKSEENLPANSTDNFAEKLMEDETIHTNDRITRQYQVEDDKRVIQTPIASQEQQNFVQESVPALNESETESRPATNPPTLIHKIM